MSKSRMHIILLGLWLFAITAPSVTTLIDVDESVMVTNLTEEEHQEQGKKGADEKKVVNSGLSDLSLLSLRQQSALFNPYLLRNSDHKAEIILPPPERIV